MSRPRFHRRFPLCLAALAAVAASSCKSGDGAADADVTEVAAITVEVAPVSRRTLRVVATYTAEIRPSAQVNVVPKLADRVLAIGFEEGDRVVQGETVLAELASELVDTGIQQAEAGVQAISAQIYGLRTQQRRLQRLVEDGIVSISQLEPVDAQIRALEAQRRQVQSGVEQANLRKEDTIVLAPMTGHVSRRYVEVGDMANPMSPIATIVRLDPVHAWLDVPEYELEQVRAQPTIDLRIASAPDRVFPATLELVSPTVDRQARTLRLRYRVDNPDLALRDGMVARAEVELVRHEDALAVPSRALILDPTGEQLYDAFVEEDGKARRVVVRIGITDGRWSEVLSGLDEGDRLIVEGFHLVADGTSVDVIAGGAEGARSDDAAVSDAGSPPPPPPESVSDAGPPPPVSGSGEDAGTAADAGILENVPGGNEGDDAPEAAPR